MKLILLIALAYLIGSVTTAILVARFLGLPDPRSQGSGNPGATNVLRLVGRKAAALTLLGDAFKGALPVWIASGLGLSDWSLAAVALAAFLGHVFPVYFGFRGGKGVATGLGIYLALSPFMALALAVVWILLAFMFRISSLAALGAALVAPVLSYWLLRETGLIVLSCVLAGLLVWRHKTNIRRILSGEEKRIGQRG